MMYLEDLLVVLPELIDMVDILLMLLVFGQVDGVILTNQLIFLVLWKKEKNSKLISFPIHGILVQQHLTTHYY